MPPATKREGVRNFHLPLSDELHRKIREEAERSGRPATALVREAVEEYLRARQRATVHAEIAAYAERWAGSASDLDEDLEAASIEC
jgi:predicted transcriptional regulator